MLAKFKMVFVVQNVVVKNVSFAISPNGLLVSGDAMLPAPPKLPPHPPVQIPRRKPKVLYMFMFFLFCIGLI